MLFVFLKGGGLYLFVTAFKPCLAGWGKHAARPQSAGHKPPYVAVGSLNHLWSTMLAFGTGARSWPGPPRVPVGRGWW
jgi:hypothetical protein